ncbi:hypothetical protein SBDP1_500005 [Syntrophobacter sp. SbD1]|nr:hypothetical protein SBDP1_500005 [Syntrophobacter sp. SbD1]
MKMNQVLRIVYANLTLAEPVTRPSRMKIC